jgi:hypothetical protein
MCAEATVTNRDWKEIESELMLNLPRGEKRPSPNHDVRQAIKADEEAFWRTSLTLWLGGMGSTNEMSTAGIMLPR